MRSTPSDTPTESPIIVVLVFSAGGCSIMDEGEGEGRISSVGGSATVGA